MAYNCPACNIRTFSTNETHPSWATLGPGIIRRRFRCSRCGHGETRYEVPRDVLQRLHRLAQAAEAAGAALSVLTASLDAMHAPEPPAAATCQSSCNLWGQGGCELGFPEAGGFFAGECAAFGERRPS